MTRTTGPVDFVDAVGGFAAGSDLDTLRRERGDARRHTQGSFDALFETGGPHAEGEPVGAAGTGLGLLERELAALRIATLNGDVALAARHRARARAVGATDAQLAALAQHEPRSLGDTRLDALVVHVDRLTLAPSSARPEHLEALRALGYGTRDLVTLTQLVGFVNYQIRLLAGLRLLDQSA